MKPPTKLTSICLFLLTVELNMAQNPFYGNQTPPPYDQNTRQSTEPNNYDRYNSDSNRYNSDTNVRYDPNNRYNDQYNRNNYSNNRYHDPYNRRDDQYRNNDPNFNRHNESNRYNDPYYNRYNDSNRYNDHNYRYNDSNRYNDPNNRYNQDPNSRYNQDNRYNQDQYNKYNVSNRPYDLGSDLSPNFRNNDRYNTQYNQDGRYNNAYNNSNNYYPHSQDPNNRYNSNRNNDPNNRYNDPNNRYNDPNNRYNDPNNRYNDPNNRYNDPNNRYNDPNRYNQDNRNNQFNQGNRPYDSGFGNPYQGSNGNQNDPNDNCCEEYCYSTDENPLLHFASKTAYQIVYGKRANQDIPECTPVQIWSINRQGTTLPTDQEIRRLKSLENLRMEILKNYDDRRSFPYKGRLCNQDLDLLRRWRWNDTLGALKDKVLTSQGIEDAKFLARRYKSKFGSLLNQQYRENYYNFQYDTSDYKTHDTYQAYIEGLFDLNKSFMVHANTDMSERILPPGYCKTWSREVENNNRTYNEYERFKLRPDYMQMVRDVYKKLGFRYTLNEAIVRDMYDMCRYEKAWYLNDPSPWCSVFTRKQLELLEYAEDLQDYYYSGYGREQNAKVGCLLVKDMYEMMRKVVNGEAADAYKVSHYFTHSTQFLRFLTALGIAKDNMPLTADNFYQHRNRQWKLSVIDPFGANLVAVLYNCQRDNKYKVMFLLNEVPVNFPECSVGLCDWNVVEQKIRPVAEYCNRDYCERGGSSTLHSFKILPVIILSLSLTKLIEIL